MKYIKKFNESLDITKESFEEQCEVYLTELNDLDISVSIDVLSKSRLTTLMTVLFINSKDGSLFEWEYVKEAMLPFLEFLDNKYIIDSIVVHDEYQDDYVLDMDDDDERSIEFDDITSDEFNSTEISWLQIKLK
jgi:hypothetical protein